MSKYATVTNSKHLKAVLDSVRNDAASFTQKLEALRATANKQKEIMVDNIVAQISELDAASYHKQYADWQKRFVTETEPQRLEILRELNSAREALSEFASQNLTDSKRLSSGYGIGTEERYRVEQSLSKAQPATLAMLARKASVEKDKTLCAVLASISDSLPRKERSFDAEKMCESVFGEDALAAREMCNEINKAFEVAMAQERAFNGSKTSSTEKIRIGLTYPDIVLPKESSQPAPGHKTSVQMIADGLDDAA